MRIAKNYEMETYCLMNNKRSLQMVSDKKREVILLIKSFDDLLLKHRITLY